MSFLANVSAEWWFALVATVMQVATLIIATVMAIPKPERRRHRMVLTVFVALGIIGALASAWGMALAPRRSALIEVWAL